MAFEGHNNGWEDIIMVWMGHKNGPTTAFVIMVGRTLLWGRWAIIMA
jgi:hypothetical protein